MVFVDGTNKKGNVNGLVVQIEEPDADCAAEKEQLHDAAVATRSCNEAKRAAAGKSRREMLLALPLMRIRFLHMGVAFRRNSDIWQVIRCKEYKKKSIPSQKCKKTSFLVHAALQRIPSPDWCDFRLSKPQ
jgi:hypothetical protein